MRVEYHPQAASDLPFSIPIAVSTAAFGALLKELAVMENLIRRSRMSVGAIGNEFAGFPKRIAVPAKSMAARLRVSERRR